MSEPRRQAWARKLLGVSVLSLLAFACAPEPTTTDGTSGSTSGGGGDAASVTTGFRCCADL
jgi:hypothetical protein